jgi:hypothetical protein
MQRMARFFKMQRERAAHEAKTDKTYLHVALPA